MYQGKSWTVAIVYSYVYTPLSRCNLFKCTVKDNAKMFSMGHIDAVANPHTYIPYILRIYTICVQCRVG